MMGTFPQIIKTYQSDELTGRLGQILQEVAAGHITLINGQDNLQAVMLDITDFELLISFVHSFNPSTDYSIGSNPFDSTQLHYNRAISAYLDGELSLAETGNQLNLSWIELLQRFTHLGIPLREGSFDLDDSIKELRAIRYQNFENWV